MTHPVHNDIMFSPLGTFTVCISCFSLNGVVWDLVISSLLVSNVTPPPQMDHLRSAFSPFFSPWLQSAAHYVNRGRQ